MIAALNAYLYAAAAEKWTEAIILPVIFGGLFLALGIGGWRVAVWMAKHWNE